MKTKRAKLTKEQERELAMMGHSEFKQFGLTLVEIPEKKVRKRA